MLQHHDGHHHINVWEVVKFSSSSVMAPPFQVHAQQLLFPCMSTSMDISGCEKVPGLKPVYK